MELYMIPALGGEKANDGWPYTSCPVAPLLTTYISVFDDEVPFR